MRLAIVAGKIIAGNDPANQLKYDALYDLFPEEEGAPKTLREMPQYMEAWMGATNTSSDKKTNYYDPDTKYGKVILTVLNQN